MNRVSVTRRSTCPGGLSDNPTRVTFLSWARRQFEIGLLQVLFEPSAEVCLYVSPRVRMLALSFATANRILARCADENAPEPVEQSCNPMCCSLPRGFRAKGPIAPRAGFDLGHSPAPNTPRL